MASGVPGIAAPETAEAPLAREPAGFVFVPSTMQTLQFSEAEDCNPRSALCADLLQTRTSEGMVARLHVNVLWRYRPEALRALYLAFPPKGPLEVFQVDEPTLGSITAVLPARQLITKEATSHILAVACRYRAHTFFSRKAAIALAIQADLRREMSELGIEVLSVQLLRPHLPPAYEAALMRSATTRLSIVLAARYKEAQRVTFATRALVASFSARATVILARGAAQARAQRAQQNAAVIAVTTAAEVRAYANMTEATHVAPVELMQYTWWDQAMRLVATGGQLRAPLRTASLARSGELFPQMRVGWTRRGD